MGISDGTHTELVEGDLREGDQLITDVSGLPAANGPSGPPGFGPRPPGGGFGPPSGGGPGSFPGGFGPPPGGGFGGPPPGFGGGGGAVVHALSDLQATLADAKTTPEQIQDKLAALRAARQKARAELAAAQKDILELLTPDQEAILVNLGLLD